MPKWRKNLKRSIGIKYNFEATRLETGSEAEQEARIPEPSQT
jgi:hypothetical protein